MCVCVSDQFSDNIFNQQLNSANSLRFWKNHLKNERFRLVLICFAEVINQSWVIFGGSSCIVVKLLPGQSHLEK